MIGAMVASLSQEKNVSVPVSPLPPDDEPPQAAIVTTVVAATRAAANLRLFILLSFPPVCGLALVSAKRSPATVFRTGLGLAPQAFFDGTDPVATSTPTIGSCIGTRCMYRYMFPASWQELCEVNFSRHAIDGPDPACCAGQLAAIWLIS